VGVTVFTAWRAPETFVNARSSVDALSTKTDVFMFGGLMFEVLTGKRPWWWIPTEELAVQRRAAGRECGPVSREENSFEAARVGGYLHYIVEGSDVSSPVARVLLGLQDIMRQCLSVNAVLRPEMRDVLGHLQSLGSDSGYVL
jgi:hypothetical protein